jgi:molecular chaperone GrpE
MTQNKEDASNEVEGQAEVVNDAVKAAEETADVTEGPDSALEQAQAETADAKDKMLRAVAESENIRRRAETDVANAHKFAIEKFASEVLAVRASLELARAVEIQDNDNEVLSKMHEGIDLTLKQLDSTFEKFNLMVIDPTGEKFNPEHHQAMSMVESDDHEPNHVVTVVQKGCLLHDRLIRPAMVMVSKPK